MIGRTGSALDLKTQRPTRYIAAKERIKDLVALSRRILMDKHNRRISAGAASWNIRSSLPVAASSAVASARRRSSLHDARKRRSSTRTYVGESISLAEILKRRKNEIYFHVHGKNVCVNFFKEVKGVVEEMTSNIFVD